MSREKGGKPLLFPEGRGDDVLRGKREMNRRPEGSPKKFCERERGGPATFSKEGEEGLGFSLWSGGERKREGCCGRVLGKISKEVSCKQMKDHQHNEEKTLGLRFFPGRGKEPSSRPRGGKKYGVALCFVFR